ncbi:MAG: hypothetical protein AMXMBFR84_45330 [Candidatus Hydrogenedentota bacterium]
MISLLLSPETKPPMLNEPDISLPAVGALVAPYVQFIGFSRQNFSVRLSIH